MRHQAPCQRGGCWSYAQWIACGEGDDQAHWKDSEAGKTEANPFLLATLTLPLGYDSIYPNRARSSGAGSVRHYVRAFLFMEHGSCLSQPLRSIPYETIGANPKYH